MENCGNGPTRFAGPMKLDGRVSSRRTGDDRAVNELGFESTATGGAGRRTSPIPYALSKPGGPRSTTRCFTSEANGIPGNANPCANSRAAIPAAVGDAALVPLKQ